jgi:hypothetical protein
MAHPITQPASPAPAEQRRARLEPVRPHHLVAAGRVITVRYLAGQSPAMVTVVCADGGAFTLRVAPPGVPDRPETRRGEQVWETEGGGLGPPRTPHPTSTHPRT